MKKLTTRFGSAVTAGLISTALIAAPLTTLVAATPAVAEEQAKLPPKNATENQQEAVAQSSDGKYFKDLQSALNWADEGTVTLLKDADETIQIGDNLETTLNLNGHRLASNNETTIIVDGKLTLNDSNGKGNVFGVTNAAYANQGGTLVINGGTFESTKAGATIDGTGTISVIGGTFGNDVTDYTKPTANVVSLKHGNATKWVVDTDDTHDIDALVGSAKSGDTLTVTRTNNDGRLTVALPDDVTNVTVVNNSKGKVYVANIVLNPGERSSEQKVEAVTMNRLYNPNSGEHFYTASTAERDHLVSVGWRSEGTGWIAPSSSSHPVYRLYNPNAGDHHYTLSAAERDHLVSVGWRYEGIGWYSDDAEQVPLWRQYNPNARAGAHNFTASKAENDHLVSVGWRAEGIGWYGIRAAK